MNTLPDDLMESLGPEPLTADQIRQRAQERHEADTTPNPGSDEAIDGGCVCPVLDNGHGRGRPGVDGTDGPSFWMNENCPMHGRKS